MDSPVSQMQSHLAIKPTQFDLIHPSDRRESARVLVGAARPHENTTEWWENLKFHHTLQKAINRIIFFFLSSVFLRYNMSWTCRSPLSLFCGPGSVLAAGKHLATPRGWPPPGAPRPCATLPWGTRSTARAAQVNLSLDILLHRADGFPKVKLQIAPKQPNYQTCF